jgi:hypothetical protein
LSGRYLEHPRKRKNEERMAKRMFNVTAHWDDEAQVFYSDSDIIGLHIEAATIDEFEAVMMDVAPGLVVANHTTKEELQ